MLVMIMIVMMVMMVMIQKLSHTQNSHTRRFCTNTFIQEFSTARRLHAKPFSHTDTHAFTPAAFTHTQTDAFTQSRFYIHRISSDIGAPLHTVPSNPKLLNTQKLLRREAFTYRWFTQTILCTGAAHRKNSHSQSFYAKVLLHSAAFTRRSFFAQKL